LDAYGAIRTEYVPTGFEEQILVSTPLVYPGESFELSFVMPPPGRYTYVCVFPGHGLTMRGTLVSFP
jgi:azurin